jgi:hypothetical protein
LSRIQNALRVALLKANAADDLALEFGRCPTALYQRLDKGQARIRCASDRSDELA